MTLDGAWKDREVRGIGLVVFTGLVVSWVTQELQHNWHSFSSWEAFFFLWVINTLAVGVFGALVAAAIAGTHKFFTGEERKEGMETLVFYVVMTVLLGALAVAAMANAVRSEDDDARLVLSVLRS